MKFNLALSVTVLAFIIAGVVRSRELGLRHDALLRNTLRASNLNEKMSGTLRTLVNAMPSSFGNGLRSLHAQGMKSLLGPSAGLRRSRRDTTDAVLEIKPMIEDTAVQTDAQMDKMVQDIKKLTENIISAADSYGGNMLHGIQVLILETGVPNMEAQMGKMVDATKDIIEKASPSLTNVIGGLVAGTQAEMEDAYSQTTDTGTKVVNNVLALIKLVYSNSKVQMAEIYMNIRSSVQTAYTQMDDMGSKIHDGMNDIMVNGYDGLKEQIGSVAGTMRSAVVDTYNLVGEPIGTSLNTMIDMMATGMDDMQQYAQKTMDGISDMTQQVYDDVSNQVGNAANTMSDRVEEIENIGQKQMDKLNGAFMS